MTDRPPAEARRPRPPALTPAQVVPLLVVLIGLVGGMVVVAVGHWRVGCLIVGAFVGIGGLERLLLPKERAGLLQARSRFFDVIALIGMSVAIIALAIAVPR
ncbi:DUF3017 domain-containing protein [Microlunatus soli]|uniref:DUF3017 domain-containing protein n=1 Tax=Microlunatus soli TaxID=630515 RepID=A0A1H1X0Y6_9ACTN|nr:DUF3017 domain-containing protein [Microlunatus soli]SDT02842.1 Protein of unknown function [Microlunatus soli]